jgi:hypothetical protein
MKYSVQIVCALLGALPAFELTAPDDNEAVDKARAKHDVPEEGGDYEVAVTCLEPTQVIDPTTKKPAERPAGFEVSRFKVSHEPKPHVAEAVYAAREAKAIAEAEEAKRSEIAAVERAKVFAELGIPDPLLATKEKVAK